MSDLKEFLKDTKDSSKKLQVNPNQLFKDYISTLDDIAKLEVNNYLKAKTAKDLASNLVKPNTKSKTQSTKVSSINKK